MYWIKKDQSNATVTDYYVDTIAEALKRAGKHITSSYSWDDLKFQKGDSAVVIKATEALHAFLKGYPYIYWAQGVWPEESYMRHRSKIRLMVCRCIEKFALKHAAFTFFVSESMKRYYEQAYHLDFSEKCYIMPCSNEPMHPDSFDEPDKYRNNIFCYAGGTAVWQCFEETVALYKKIEEKHAGTKLLLLVRDRVYAQGIAEKYGVRNYEIDYVPIEKLQERLAEVKFGFVIRKSDPVNYVATPTKIMTYLANGVIPIFSSCLAGIEPMLRNTRFKVCFDNNESVAEIERLMSVHIETGNIKDDYQRIYNGNYNKENHIEKIAKLFQTVAL